MLLWIGCCVFLLTIAAPTTQSEGTIGANMPHPLVIFVVGAVVVVVIAGLVYVMRQDCSQEKDRSVLYQGPATAMEIPVEPRNIYAPVPKKPTPPLLDLPDQSFDKRFISPKIRVDPAETYSQ